MASKSSSKTFPSTSASKFEVGHVANGEDGLKYIVTSSLGKNDKPKKSWTLFEESEVVTEEIKELVEEVKELEIEVKKQKTQKREKKSTSSDEEKPKRMPNEYNRFISTKMAEYRESHPEITNGREKMKMAAAEWKTIKLSA
jgi:hypothetical protein